LDLEVNANLIEKVWYKKRLESLENRIVYERGEIYNAMRNKIIELSTRVGILSTQTSFMLLEEMYEPVLGIALRKFLPVTINTVEEENNPQNSSSFYYNYSLSGVQFDDELLNMGTRQELLRVLATQQLASGAFASNYEEENLLKVLSTIKAILAFTLGKEDITIYRNILAKAIGYLCNNIEEMKNYEESILSFLYLALKTSLNKGIIKSENKEVVIEKSNYLESTLSQKGIDINTIQQEFISYLESNLNTIDPLNNLIDKAIVRIK